MKKAKEKIGEFEPAPKRDPPKKLREKQVVKVVTWYNKKTRQLFYGIDIKVEDEWCHLMEDGEPLFFVFRESAQKKVKELRAELQKNPL